MIDVIGAGVIGVACAATGGGVSPTRQRAIRLSLRRRRVLLVMRVFLVVGITHKLGSRKWRLTSAKSDARRRTRVPRAKPQSGAAGFACYALASAVPRI